MSLIPEKSINFSVYLEGRDLLGMAEGTIPALEAMTSEVKGAGVAGTVDSIVLGHFNSTTLNLKWRTVTDDFFKLYRHITNTIELHASLQRYESALGVYLTEPLYVYLKATTKSSTPGNLVSGDNMDTEMEFEITYMKIYLAGKERVELDKYNYIYRVDGIDYLATVRADLGKI